MSTNDNDDHILTVFLVLLSMSILLALAFQSLLVFIGGLFVTMWTTRKCIK